MNLPDIVVSLSNTDTGETIDWTVRRASLTTKDAPYAIAMIQMTIAYLRAYSDVLRQLTELGAETTAREIRSDEKRAT